MKFLNALRRSPMGMIGALLMICLLCAGLGASLFDLPPPNRGSLSARLVGPTWDGIFSPGPHPFGTDQLGRDILSRVVSGSQLTLTIALASVLLGSLIGVPLGILAGYRGGILDRVLMRLVDVQLSIPLVLFALLIVSVLGPSLVNLIIVLGLTSWTSYARIVRGQVLAVKQREFVSAARAIGASSGRIMLKHIFPNVITPILVVATLELGRVIVMDATLSFLGLGVQPPAASWGRMLSEGRVYIANAWWVVTFPGLAIMLTVLSVSLLGDFLRDYFDPKTRTN